VVNISRAPTVADAGRAFGNGPACALILMVRRARYGATHRKRALQSVFRVQVEIGDMDDLTFERDSTDHGTAAGCQW
jgi:hypothetical protein